MRFNFSQKFYRREYILKYSIIFSIIILLISVLIDLGIRLNVIKPLILINNDHMNTIFTVQVTVSILGTSVIGVMMGLSKEKYLGIENLSFMSKIFKIREVYLFEFLALLSSYIFLVLDFSSSIFILFVISSSLVFLLIYQVFQSTINKSTFSQQVLHDVSSQIHTVDSVSRLRIFNDIKDANIHANITQNMLEEKDSFMLLCNYYINTKEEDTSFNEIHDILVNLFIQNLKLKRTDVLLNQINNLTILYKSMNKMTRSCILFDRIAYYFYLNWKNVSYNEISDKVDLIYDLYDQLKINSKCTKDDSIPRSITTIFSNIYSVILDKRCYQLDLNLFRKYEMSLSNMDYIDLMTMFELLLEISNSNKSLFDHIFRYLITSSNESSFISSKNSNTLIMLIIVYYIYINWFDDGTDGRLKIVDLTQYDRNEFDMYFNFYLSDHYLYYVDIFDFVYNKASVYLNYNLDQWIDNGDFSYTSKGMIYDKIISWLFLWILSGWEDETKIKFCLEKILDNGINFEETIKQKFDKLENILNLKSMSSNDKIDTLIQASEFYYKNQLIANQLDRTEIDRYLNSINFERPTIGEIRSEHYLNFGVLEKYAKIDSDFKDMIKKTVNDYIHNIKSSEIYRMISEKNKAACSEEQLFEKVSDLSNSDDNYIYLTNNFSEISDRRLRRSLSKYCLKGIDFEGGLFCIYKDCPVEICKLEVVQLKPNQLSNDDLEKYITNNQYITNDFKKIHFFDNEAKEYVKNNLLIIKIELIYNIYDNNILKVYETKN
ncbi:hypothetical protein CYJ56_00885 [Facklamia hominis]|nr:hypothetical protein CYJ56_00885 [Facklamia hominis]